MVQLEQRVSANGILALTALTSQEQTGQGPVSSARRPGALVQPQQSISLREPSGDLGGTTFPSPCLENQPVNTDGPLLPSHCQPRNVPTCSRWPEEKPSTCSSQVWLTFQRSSRWLTSFKYDHGSLNCWKRLDLPLKKKTKRVFQVLTKKICIQIHQKKKKASGS